MNELIWLAIISSTFTCSGISRNTSKVFMSDTSTGIIQKIEMYPLQQIQFFKAQKQDLALNMELKNCIDARPFCSNCRMYSTYCSFNSTSNLNNEKCIARMKFTIWPIVF